MTTKKKTTPKKPTKYKSKFEETFGKNLEKQGLTFTYEKVKIKYVTEHTYSLDFSIENGILLVETKGYFKAADRNKHLEIKKQHPSIDIRFIFMNDAKIHKNSSTRYSDWCTRHGFKYAISPMGICPADWVAEIKQKELENVKQVSKTRTTTKKGTIKKS